jgi:hypothetical protein
LLKKSVTCKEKKQKQSNDIMLEMMMGKITLQKCYLQSHHMLTFECVCFLGNFCNCGLKKV